MDIIQLLPVNDTGRESSPYSALSAFALHPIYLRISDLPELESMESDDRAGFDAELLQIRRDHATARRICYRELHDAKSLLLRKIFRASVNATSPPRELQEFIDQTAWLRDYAAFCMLKDQYDHRPWTEWSTYRDPTHQDIAEIWADSANLEALLYHAWVQWRIDAQFAGAVEELHRMGILLKGDLPILMNQESADVWFHRDFFVTAERAGAPPDMFSRHGQNWDFPIYNWKELAAADYSWWKERLLAAARYYSAYRIDHVLGFFRIWSIGEDNLSGLLGRFNPSVAASVEQLNRIGFDDERIRWLAEPHITGKTLRSELGDQSAVVAAASFRAIGDEDLYVFADSIRGERDIHALDLPPTTREWLVDTYGDRALVPVESHRMTGDLQYAPAWSFRSCSRYQTLTDSEKAKFESLVAELGQESERIWEEQARALLGFMRDTTDMLPCAEDLGVVPRCVPEVLADLNILGLRIPRWSRLWDDDGQPFVRPADYPLLSVCAPSVHDTTTIRGWWKEDDDRPEFWKSIGLNGEPPSEYEPATARQVVRALLLANSVIVVLQPQDLFALVPGILPDDPEDERVNVPGTTNDINWSHRLELTTEELISRSDLNTVVADLVAERRSRPLSGGQRG